MQDDVVVSLSVTVDSRFSCLPDPTLGTEQQEKDWIATDRLVFAVRYSRSFGWFEVDSEVVLRLCPRSGNGMEHYCQFVAMGQ